MGCGYAAALAGFGMAVKSSAWGASLQPQAVPWEPGAVTAVPWPHGRGPCPPLDL